jgi:hypothetical protein
MIVLLLMASLLLSACGGTTPSTANEKEKPASVVPIEGSDFKQVILTEDAAQRIDLQVEPVREEQEGMVIPYSAVLYGLNGETWAYTNPDSLTFVRHVIAVAYIEGDMAILSDGPAAGTEVVTVGVAELWGTETGVGK